MQRRLRPFLSRVIEPLLQFGATDAGCTAFNLFLCDFAIHHRAKTRRGSLKHFAQNRTPPTLPEIKYFHAFGEKLCFG